MGDLTNLVPQTGQTTMAIMAYYKRVGDAEKPRRYLGMSQIGHECERYLWYCFRHCCRENFDGRMYRLFETGDLAEERFCDNMRAIGYQVHDRDDSGNQFSFNTIGGHYGGHMDAAILGVLEAPKTWHVGEFKTHSNKSFNELKNNGVKLAKPQHYHQMQAYMRYSGMTRALYLAVNKDTDELYDERVRYDANEARQMEEKAKRIITAVTPPCRIGNNPDDWRCKYCPAKSLCYGSNPPEAAVPVPTLSCRQCVHATPELDTETGRWSCAKHKRSLSDTDQARTCNSHLFIPDLITFARSQDAGQDWIEYKNDTDGAVWRQGPDSGQFSSLELTRLPGPMVGGDCLMVKEALGGTVIKTTYSLPEKYQDHIAILWTGEITAIQFAWEKLFKEELCLIKPIQQYEDENCTAAEFSENRLIYIPKNIKQKPEIRLECEIRKGLE